MIKHYLDEKTAVPVFRLRKSSLSIIARGLKSYIFKKLTQNSLPLFMRGGDTISISPQVFGVYEPDLTYLIQQFAKVGYADFLIDIGANIGLTACQNGRCFKEVHMYEPNPLCCHILHVNAQIALEASCFYIYPFGLGAESKTGSLTIPKHNWGGAFIHDAINHYDEALLAQKDGFTDLNSQNYFSVAITLESAQRELENRFRHLVEKGLKQGVIKIDVEGYEMAVLGGIARALPENMQVYIVFESWDRDLAIEDILCAFSGRASIWKLHNSTLWKNHWPTWRKWVKLLCTWRFSSQLAAVTDGDYSGQLVLKVN